jgi:anhydro-N-acetylmuramic acid kinase
VSAARLVIGCMTGTSIDGLDAAAVRLSGDGLDMRAELLDANSWPLGELAPELRAVAEQQPMTAGQMAGIAWRFGEFHARCFAELVNSLAERPDLIAVHGQTVFHKPPVSWQLINPAPIARRLGCPVVFDLRQADLAACGQGAPITPIADAILYRDAGSAYAVVNLGGFCNITLITRDALAPNGVRIEGRDVCACNQVLDAVAREALDMPFDSGGAAALRGTVNNSARDELIRALRTQAAARRSLGTGDEVSAWVRENIAVLRGEDLAASATAAIGECIAAAVGGSERLILAGGGARNEALLRAIRHTCRATVSPSDNLRVPGDFREAMAMAVLGELCRQRVPITIAGITGRAEPGPVSGHWVLP